MTKYFAIAALALLIAAPTSADEVIGNRRYCTEFFSAESPTTAQDMLSMVPGFTLIEADAEVRGYAGAQSNVLVDGARPASKRESIKDILKRIPAHAVDCIELIRAGSGVDMFGYTVLANVIRNSAQRPEASAELGSLWLSEGTWKPLLAADYAREHGERRLELALASTPEMDEDMGDGHLITRRADGQLDEDNDTTTRRIQVIDKANIGWRQPMGSGTLNVDTSVREARDAETGVITTRYPAFSTERDSETETLQEAELGLRYGQILNDSRVDVIASQQLGWLDVVSRSRTADSVERFLQTTRSGESLLRVDLQHERSADLQLNAGLELALNQLKGEAELSEDGRAISLPGSRVRITEQRGEAGLGLTWQASTAWRVETALQTERSSLRQSGDTELVRRFSYYKPSMATTWAQGAQQWRLSLTRLVGQLDFEDFVASASLDTNVVSAGNVELEPDKTWRTMLSWERSFGADSAATLTWTHDQISDVVDRVPVIASGGVFDAPGNIGNGERHALTIEFNSTLGWFGLETARLTSKLHWQRSRVSDPTTGQRRSISEEKPFKGEIDLTHTIAPLTWGISVELAERETEYRFDEIKNERVDTSWRVFAERSIGKRWRIRTELTDLSGLRIREQRSRYDGLRSAQVLDESEYRQHHAPAQLLLTVRYEMGE